MKKYLLILFVSTSLFGGNILAAPDEFAQQENQEIVEQNGEMPQEPQIGEPLEEAQAPDISDDQEINGRFYIIPPMKNENAEFMIPYRYLEKISSELNRVINLNDNIGLTFSDCNEANAFYNPRDKSITFCNELLSSMAEKVTAKNKDANVFTGAVYFVLFHEIGHAIIDNLDLPITGREEDVADQFALWNMLTDYQRGAETDQAMLNAIRGAINFFSDDLAIEESHLADEHSLNRQRLNNVLCWAYGSDIPQFSSIASKGMLPESRLQRCSGEYSRMNKAMTTVLSPYLKL